MNVLVTGGAGFIGSNIVRHLLAAGDQVRVLDDLSSGRAGNLDDVRDRVHFIEGDIRCPATVRDAVKGVSAVLHLAARPSVIESIDDPVTSNDVNVCGTLNCLTAAREAGVDRFVFSSSCAVYGDSPELPKREEMALNPLSPYAAQKAAGEFYCRLFYRLYGLKTFVLRYFNVFGPRQNPKSQYAAVIPNFIGALRAGGSATIFGDGGQTRDFVFVGDVARANLACCTAPADAAGSTYNVCNGVETSVEQLFEALKAVIGSDAGARHEPAREGEVRRSYGDASAAKRRLAWAPVTDLETGLRETARYFEEHEAET